jgi:UDP-N-acetylmuramate dehydrogenase
MIPGTVGASPVQNIGAYGVELQDRFESLDAIDLVTGRSVHAGRGAVRVRLPRLGLQARAPDHAGRLARLRPGRPGADHAGAFPPAQALEGRWSTTSTCSARWPTPASRQPTRGRCSTGSAPSAAPSCPTRACIGNAGSFFKNPTVTPEQCADIIARDPKIVHYPMPDGSIKLAAGWLIDACGWKGKSVGNAGVYEKQALVLVNRGGATRRAR